MVEKELKLRMLGGVVSVWRNFLAPWAVSKCCTYQAKWDWGPPRAAPATQKWDWGPPSAAPATQKQPAPIALWHWDAVSAAPATQNETEVLHCLAKKPAPIAFNRRRTSADLSGGTPSAAPATQNETEVLQKQPDAHSTESSPDFRGPLLRYSECCTCHAKWDWGPPKAAGAHSTQSSPGLRGLVWRCSECCTCHAKWDRGTPSAAPAMQNETEVLQKQPAPIVLNRHRASADLSGGAPSAAPARQNETEVLQVLHLPRKMRLRSSKCCPPRKSSQRRGPLWRCSECCTCQAKWDWGAPRAAPATQNETEVLQVLARHAKEAGAHSTQSSPGLRGLVWRCSEFCTCPAKAAGAHSTQSSPGFRGPLLRCSEFCTCHPKWDWGASAAPATQNERSSNVTWWCCVWWCSVDGVVLMVLSWWCRVDDVVLMMLFLMM